MVVPVPLPFLLATLLILLGILPGWGVYLALPLAALMVAIAIWSCRPQLWAWRWAGWGSVLWAAEEIVWAVARLVFDTTFLYLTDPLYFAGLACWFVAVMKMNQRAMPKISLLVALPALLFIGWLLLQNHDFALLIRFPLFDLALLIVAVPAIERSFYGQLPEGRLLWLLGLFCRVLAGSLFIWLDDYPFTPQLFFFLWLISYTFVALGAWIELSGVSGGLWPVAYGLLGLEAVTGLVIAITLMAHPGAPHMALVPALFLGYMLFIAMMLLVIADRNRRLRAEDALKQWSALLEALASLPPAKNHEAALGGIMATLQRVFPDLVGITTTVDETAHYGDSGAYSFPVVAEGAEVGRLFFRAEPLNIAVLDAIAPSLAAQLERALAQLRWYQQALTDPLTGLHNRRVFELQAANFVSLAFRHEQPLSLAMLDIDHFKRANDHYGHPTGDEVLKGVANLLQHHTREEDLVLRWGGEEFVLLLYGSDLAQASEIVERIRAGLSQQSLVGVAWPITISCGLVGGIVPTSNGEVHQWFAVADQALLKAKEAGRDRRVVVSADQALTDTYDVQPRDALPDGSPQS